MELIDLDEPLTSDGHRLWFRAATLDGRVFRVAASPEVVAGLDQSGGAHRVAMCVAAGRALDEDPEFFAASPFVELAAEDLA